ncbi:peptidoglycan-binding domain-containing protein [Paenibacillus sp. SN-8-1]|uniref:peptidoglycan-binding domain-containing protein n=1 Tax=Paenibacillus sp. SN-8-1 TaxID=3435409 RepID=UPI003D9A1817
MKKKKLSAIALSVSLVGSLMLAGVASAASNDFTGWPKLQSGSSGGYVRALQANLYAFGQSAKVGTIDGSYGSGTTSAVKAFQSGEGLTSDGIVGSGSWNKMSEYTTVETYNGSFYLWTGKSTTYWVDYINQSGGGLKYYLRYKSDSSLVGSGTVY